MSMAADIHNVDGLEERIRRLEEALTPSGGTKAEYIGEFHILVDAMNEDGETESQRVAIPWTSIKAIMAAIRARADRT